MQNVIIISVLLINAIFLQVNKYISQLTKYEHKNIRESILTTRICLPLILRNNHSLNALNLRRLELVTDKNVGPKNHGTFIILTDIHFDMM